jgi:hypothetical protein
LIARLLQYHEMSPTPQRIRMPASLHSW